MPHAPRSHIIENEQALLAILWHGWPQAEMLTTLPKDFFIGAGHNWLYNEFIIGRKSGRPLDRSVVHYMMGALPEPLDADILDDIIEADTNPESVAEYLRVIIDANCERIAAALPSLAVGQDQETIATLVRRMQDDITQMRNVGIPQERSFTVATKTPAYFGPRPPAIPTGFETLDLMFGKGMRRREMTIIAASAGAGKSITVATIAHNVVTGRRCVPGTIEDRTYHDGPIGHVLYVSKEMDSRSIMFRLYSSLSECPVSTFEGLHEVVCRDLGIEVDEPEIFRVMESPHYREAVQRGARQLCHNKPTNPTEMAAKYFLFVKAAKDFADNNFPLHFLDMENHRAITVEMIRDEVRAINYRAKRPADRVALVVVDYIQILNVVLERGEQRSAALERSSMALKDLALSEDCHVLCISSMNRDAGAAGMDRIRDSGGIQFNADNVIMMDPFRNITALLDFPTAAQPGNPAMPAWVDLTHPDYPSPLTIIRLYTEKVRNGVPGRTYYLTFQGNIQRIASVPFTYGETLLKPAIAAHQNENRRENVRSA